MHSIIISGLRPYGPACIPAEINTPYWNRKLLKWLDELELEKVNKQIMDGQLSTLTHMRQNTLNVTKQIRSLSKTEQYQQETGLLMTIPGIGLITAMSILTALENMGQVKFTRQAILFYRPGPPSTNSSGETERMGDITPRGHKVLRAALVGSAWGVARTDPALAKSYNHYCKRMNPNI